MVTEMLKTSLLSKSQKDSKCDILCAQNRFRRLRHALTFHHLDLFQVLCQSGTKVFELCVGGVTGAPAATRETTRSHRIMGKVLGLHYGWKQR